MSKFRVRFKLQGLEVEIDGTREDLPAISQNLGAQLANLLEPAVGIIEGENAGRRKEVRVQPSIVDVNPKRKSARRKSNGSSNAAGAETTEAVLDWIHDSSKYGMPDQSWNTAKKALWLIYVVGEILNTKTLSARQISETFNKHFKQAGQILAFNVTRDLGVKKVKSKPSPVGEDTTSEPSGWFLTDEGIRFAQEMIATKTT